MRTQSTLISVQAVNGLIIHYFTIKIHPNNLSIIKYQYSLILTKHQHDHHHQMSWSQTLSIINKLCQNRKNNTPRTKGSVLYTYVLQNVLSHLNICSTSFHIFENPKEFNELRHHLKIVENGGKDAVGTLFMACNWKILSAIVFVNGISKRFNSHRLTYIMYLSCFVELALQKVLERLCRKMEKNYIAQNYTLRDTK